MRLSNAFTRRLFGLDRGVTWFMMLVCILSLGLVGYKLSGDKPCMEVVVAISSITNQKNNIFFENQVIRFAAPLDESETVEWNFGDNSKASGGRATHMYKQEGTYPVTVVVNGRCSHTETVIIKKLDTETIDKESSIVKEFGNPIDGNFSPQMGRTEIYSSNKPATSWEWSVDFEKSMPVKRTSQASFTFPRSGQYTLRLILDGDPGKTYTRAITVAAPPMPSMVGGNNNSLPPPQVRPNIEVVIPPPAPKPAETVIERKDPVTVVSKPEENKPVATTPAAPKIKTTTMDRESWEDNLKAVCAGEMTLNDFKLYVANLDEPIVTLTVNAGKGEKIAFSELYNRLKNDKKIDEGSIKVEPFYESNLLTRLLVSYKRKKSLF